MHSPEGAPHILFSAPWSFTHVVKTKCFQINLPTYQYSKLNSDHVTSEQGGIFSCVILYSIPQAGSRTFCQVSLKRTISKLE